MWTRFIGRQPGMRFVFCGHVLNNGAGYLASRLPDGKTVHQILANYQNGVKPDRGHGGGGCLRLLQFLPDGKTVRVKTYSPLYDKLLTETAHQFDLTVD